MKPETHLIIGLLTVFIATFMLIYVVQNIENITRECKKTETQLTVCKRITGFTFPVIVSLLIISGFIIIICVTTYILLSPKGLVW